VIATIGSLAGSSATQKFVQDWYVSVNGVGNTHFGYRISKAAAHLLTITLAKEYEKDGLIFLVIHPGTVDTETFRSVGGSAESIPSGEPTAQESAVGQLELIHKATISDSGKFFNWNGNDLPF